MPQTATDITETVTQTEIEDLSSILGTPGPDSITLPEDTNKPNIFSKSTKPVDFKFVDEPAKKEPTAEELAKIEAAKANTLVTQAEATKKAEEAAKIKAASAEILTDVLKEVNGEEDTPEAKAAADAKGRPTLSKDAMLEVTKKLIEKKLLSPFDEDKKLEDYTIKDFEELIEANFKDREAQIQEKTPIEFFDSLPEELQVAAKYHADGGQDMKGLFKALSEVEETRELNPEVEGDQAAIVREYLKATRFGSIEEIDEEITSWKDLGKLEEKATKFKPKLDQMSQQRVAQKLAGQEKLKQQQQESAQNYVNSVYETLKPAELNGLKLDKKTQSVLYQGLTQPNYPSISGRNTNLLGHLLEKHQYVEPNHALIAEALWLLSDPEGYRTKVKEIGKEAAIEDTVRKLKTEEGKKKGAAAEIEQDEVKTRTIKRSDNFFKR